MLTPLWPVTSGAASGLLEFHPLPQSYLASLVWLWFDSDTMPFQVLALNFPLTPLCKDFGQLMWLLGSHCLSSERVVTIM